MSNDTQKPKNPMTRELFLLGIVLFISACAVLYLIYKAAFCFDPYYSFKTTGNWGRKALPCVSLQIFPE